MGTEEAWSGNEKAGVGSVLGVRRAAGGGVVSGERTNGQRVSFCGRMNTAALGALVARQPATASLNPNPQVWGAFCRPREAAGNAP